MANRKVNKSNPTIIQTDSYEYLKETISVNENTFETVMATFMPELFRVWQAVKLYNINPAILPTIIKGIADVCYSSKLGEVIIEIRPDKVTGEPVIMRVRSIDTNHLDVGALNKSLDNV